MDPLGILMIVVVLVVFVLPIVAVVWLAKASTKWTRNVSLAALLQSSPDMKPVGVGLRLVAFLLDSLVFLIVLGLLAVGLNALLGNDSGTVGAVVALVGWFVYFAGMEAVWGATVGKMAFRLKVVRADAGGPGVGAALVRNLCKLYGAYTLLGVIVTVVCISGSPSAQRFGDRLVGTTVVRRTKGASGASVDLLPAPPAV